MQLSWQLNGVVQPPFPPRSNQPPMLPWQVSRGLLASVSEHLSWQEWQAQLDSWPDVESLNISVLGSSSTSGCGGSEPPHEQRCANLSMALDKVCRMEVSWVRHFSDAMRGSFGGRLNLAVHPRNAVGPAYFSRCSSRFVDGHTNAILLDIAQVKGVTVAVNEHLAQYRHRHRHRRTPPAGRARR